jgi:hypothetical protein
VNDARTAATVFVIDHDAGRASVTGMQVILPKNSKLTFTITLSD